MGRMNLPVPTLGLVPGNAAPVLGVRLLYEAEVEPRYAFPESRPLLAKSVIDADPAGCAGEVAVAGVAGWRPGHPAGEIAALIESAPHAVKVFAIAFWAAAVFRVRAAPL